MTVSVLPETQESRKIYLDVILGHFVYGFVDSTAKFEICLAESISFPRIRNQNNLDAEILREFLRIPQSLDRGD